MSILFELLEALLSQSAVDIIIESILTGSVVLFLLYGVHGGSRTIKAPRIGKSPWGMGLARARKEFTKHGKRLTEEGYARYKDSMYWVQTADMDRLVLSNKYLDELRKLSDVYLDSKSAVVERNLGWCNRVDIILKSSVHADVCRNQLVQNLDKVTTGQICNLGKIFQSELHGCQAQDFRYYTASETMLNIVNRSIAKVIVGEPLCDNETWLRTSLDTTVYTGLICSDLLKYPAFLRPLVYFFAKSRKILDDNFTRAQGLLYQAFQERQRGGGNVDILQWLMDSNKADHLDVPFLTNQTLFVATAATRSTAASIVNTTFDLIAFSQYQEELREEIDQVLIGCGGWSLDAIQKMEKLDSFIKESQRLNHHILLSFNRKVRRDVTLSDGLTIPSGTFISTSAYWTARDPDIFEGGDQFLPWRWFNLRKAAERAGKNVTPYLSTSTSPENLHWGYGRNACPGRFMASTEVKLIVAWILKHYEIAFPDGQSGRPESFFVGERVIPSPSQKMGLRLRQK